MGKYEDRSARAHVTLVAFRHGGTHLIKPLIKRVCRLPQVDLGKEPRPDHQPNGPVVVFLRDPRNLIVSKLRWHRRRNGNSELTPEETDEALAELIGRKWIKRAAMLASEWRERPGAWVLRFEDLAGPFGSYHAGLLAAELGSDAPAGADAYLAVAERGHTFTGRHSDHSQWFGPRAHAAWQDARGSAILQLMGYPE